MSWWKFWESKAPPVVRPSYGDFLTSWKRVREEVEAELTTRTQNLRDNWPAWSEQKGCLGEEEWHTAVESCLWANRFLKMIEQIELEAYPQDWVGLVLETVMRELEKDDKGCRIRYSRGMLQEYGESGRGYAYADRCGYFGTWIWNANYLGTDLDVESQTSLEIGKVLLGEDEKAQWYKTS
jgi:hypothetical protein